MDRALGSCVPHNQTQSQTLGWRRPAWATGKQSKTDTRRFLRSQTKTQPSVPGPPLSVVTASPGAWPCSPCRLSGLSQDKPGVRCASGATTSSPHVG